MTIRIRKSLNNRLIAAVQSDNFIEAQRLLDDGADPNCQSGSEEKRTLLEISIRKSDPTISLALINTLMSHGADPNFTRKNDNGTTTSSPFMVACMRGNEKAVSAMLDSTGPIKVDLLKPQSDQWMSFMSVACSSSISLMKKLQNFFEENILSQKSMKSHLEKGHLWLSVDERARNAFMHTDHVENKRWILDCNFSDEKKIIEQKDKNGETALWISVFENNQKCVEFLLGRGARTDVINFKGESLLQAASKISQLQYTQASKNILGLLQAVDASRKARTAIDELMSSNQSAKPC